MTTFKAYLPATSMRFIALFLICYGITFAVDGQTIIYVKKGAAGNGTSWAQAFPDLQQAITAANSISGAKQIWVARGQYTPSSTGDRTVSFVLPSQTFLYGGFIGNETTLQSRNWVANRTVLSGDLGAQFNILDNSYHVVLALNVDQNSGVDGFIITQGNANGSPGYPHHDSGGGMLIIGKLSATNPKVNNCEFIHNDAASYGGGLAIISDGAVASSEITNSYFNGNKAGLGAGAANVSMSGSGQNSPVYINCSFALNTASQYGGGVANVSSASKLINCTIDRNNGLTDGGGVYNVLSTTEIRNSVFWRNYKTFVKSASQIITVGGTPVIKDNIVQGGFGVAADNNVNSDPLFVREPVAQRLPRTSIVPTMTVEPRYEKQLAFSGLAMPGGWAYATYKDHTYNKLYISGRVLQILDFNNLTNNLPTSSLHEEVFFGRTQRLERAIHNTGNKIFFASVYTGMVSVDRATGAKQVINLLDGEPGTHTGSKVQDIVVDNANNLLYASVFQWPDDKLYGIVEWNLTTNVKRWITETSSPLGLPTTKPNSDDNSYWAGHRIYLDEVSNIFYYSMGNGIWWWNRATNETGVYNTSGGLPLLPGNPQLPSNLATSMMIDHTEDKMYIGTHAGLFVWDRKNKTSRVYNTQNTPILHNLVNSVDINNDKGLVYAACETGGLLEINKVSGEIKFYSKDSGNDVFPQLFENRVASVRYDNVDKKLYVNTDNGGIWIKDYANLIQDFGDLTLKHGSPALDKAVESVYPQTVTNDIKGIGRFFNYSPVVTTDLDMGAYERIYNCIAPTVDFSFTKANGTHTFTPLVNGLTEDCTVTYLWEFGDGTTSTAATPQYAYATADTYAVKLKIQYTCGPCTPTEIVVEHPLEIQTGLCGNIYCDDSGGVSIGSLMIPEGYRLSLKGKAVIEGGKILLQSRWPDFVFDENYALMPLDSLKDFVQKNKHLPGIPSAKEAISAGVDVEEMSTKLLQKTEELTLYLLNIEARLRRLEEERTKAQPDKK